MQSDNTNELAAALAKAQGQMKPATFNKTVTFSGRSYKYADLASVIEALRKPLADNNLAIVQATRIYDEGMVLTTRLLHASGQWIGSEYPLPNAASPQALGSALTYAKRYSITSLLCIAADEDDDAQGAQAAGQKAAVPASKIKPQTVAAPVNPGTGEVSPHVIVAGADAEWVPLFAAAIMSSRTLAELSAWEDLNTGRLDEIEKHRPKTSARIDTAIENMRENILARVD